VPGNHLDEAIGGWCPSCRTAFRPGFERCVDCDLELVDELPPLPVRRRLDVEPGDAVDYDLGDWRDDQRDGLTLLLRVSEVPFSWAGPVLTVPPSAEAEVDALVDEIDGGADLSIPDEELPEDGSPPVPFAPAPLAERWRRLIGAVVDGLVLVAFTLLWALTVRGVDDLWLWWISGQVFWLANEVLGVAVWGRTIGKLVVGTRVVTVDDEARPGWRRATIRMVVATGPSLVPIRIPLLRGWTGPVWAIAVFGPILGAGRRGLHDRAAGTTVVRAR
jgi:uncharacterized RDD family membrane protein YckC